MRAINTKVIILEMDAFEAAWILAQAQKAKRGETSLSKSIRNRIRTTLEPLKPLRE